MTFADLFTVRLRALLLGVLVCVSCAGAEANLPAGGYRTTEVIGNVLVRAKVPGVPRRLEAEAALAEDASAIITNAGARAELFDAAGGRWRIGSLALWMPADAGARLLAGTIMVEVPAGQTREIDALAGRAMLGHGLWMVQAVENDGLKLICIDGPAVVRAVEPAGEGKEPAGRELRPGDVVFLRPGGREFGPVVTIFLRETLATSRLINGFAQPLPQMKRLAVQALTQAERLKRVTNAFVGGAKTDDGFQLVVPKPPSGQQPKR